jgi:4-hydroxy-2-oxoglutarate aldolase
MKLQGMFAAAATPFDHTGAVYRAKVQHNFDKWRRTSLAGFVLCGPAGEGPLLDAQEKIEVLRFAAPVVPAGRTLILDVTAESVQCAADLALKAADAGAHAVISLPPYAYRNVSGARETRLQYFRTLADRSSLPVIVHNAPRITGVDLGPENIAQLAEHPNIQGLVEENSSSDRISRLRVALPKEFSVLGGTESQVWDALKTGAAGAVLPFASAAPYSTIAVWEAFRTREEEAGIDWQARIAHPSLLVTEFHGVPGLKHAMDLNGYYGGPPRLPFTAPNAGAQQEIADAFRDLKG